MYTYCVRLMSLLEQLTEVKSSTIKPAFAEDVMSTGTANGNTKVMRYLEDKGPLHHFYAETKKSIYIFKG